MTSQVRIEADRTNTRSVLVDAVPVDEASGYPAVDGRRARRVAELRPGESAVTHVWRGERLRVSEER